MHSIKLATSITKIILKLKRNHRKQKWKWNHREKKYRSGSILAYLLPNNVSEQHSLWYYVEREKSKNDKNTMWHISIIIKKIFAGLSKEWNVHKDLIIDYREMFNVTPNKGLDYDTIQHTYIH